MDALRKEEIYTLDDIYALPEGERAELIDGKIYYMALKAGTCLPRQSCRRNKACSAPVSCP